MEPQDTSLNTPNSLRGLNGRETAKWYLAFALCAALADGASKWLAVEQLTNKTVLFGSRFAFMLVFNTAGAGGSSWGPHTVLVNICLTAFSVVLISGIVAQLARIDGRAAVSLGLVAGGATGNLVSMLFGPTGVADFLAVRMGDRAIVCNVADVALWGGAMLLIPVVRSLVVAIRSERETKARQALVFAQG